MFNGIPIRIPMENVNDENVILVQWLITDGACVSEDQPIAEVETSKAVIELYAPGDGVIQFAAEAGSELAVGSVVAHLSPETNMLSAQVASSAKEDEKARSLPTQSISLTDPTVTASPDLRFSRKAIELLNQHGLSPASFGSQSMIREADVLALLNSRPKAEPDQDSDYAALRGISLDGVSLPSAFIRRDAGKLDQQFLESLRHNRTAFGALSSEQKCEQYRKHGAVIGSDVVLGRGTVILSPQLVLEDGVRIGDNGTVECSERFIAGKLASFRENLSVEGSTVLIGENVFGCRRVEISGGSANPWAFLSIGDTTFIGDNSILDISRPILIGKEVFLTQRAIVITHNIGHSILEGFENRFEPVVLEDRCQIGMSSIIYAGSRIGNSAIVGSNSYVVSSLPAGKLAIGVPARVVRNAARTLSHAQQVDLALQMVLDFRELLSLKGLDVSDVVNGTFSVQHQGKRYQIRFTEHYSGSSIETISGDQCVIWTLRASAAPPRGCTLIDLVARRIEGDGGIFADSAREFLRKRGIRCEPGPWRYRQGLI
jgi:acetyltransferase-like isoleucine patch superfamily enzyme